MNRPYRDFRYGYVVDFADIKENFVETNNRYLKELHDAIYGREGEDEFDDGTNPGVLLASKDEIEAKLENPPVTLSEGSKIRIRYLPGKLDHVFLAE